MYRLSYVCCLLAACCISICSYSQQPTPKTLLWRISGKGLQQPSYLYGTIHLTDNRLFMLGDSVYRAIEKSEGLAIEVNPDEMGAYYVNKAINQVEGTKIQDLLAEKDYNKYSEALSKKFKKPASEVTTSDIVAEKNKWLLDYLEKGEMATFLDAYLYNIARRQGKWVGGVEDISDQAGLLDGLVDRSDIDFMLAGDSANIKATSNKMMEHMVALYGNQDLEGIEKLTAGESAQYKDLLLIRRNVKMARRIDSLTALRTMFIAVGSAHLPGDSGVIQLLQKRGFTVEPVFSSKKINAKEYTYKEVHLPWTESEDKQGLYKVSLPGHAVDVKMFGLIEMKFLFDIYNLATYGTMAVVNPRSGIHNDSLYNEMAQRIFRTKEKLTPKTVFNNGIEGRDYMRTLAGEKVRMQVYMHENVVYVAFMNSVKQNMLSSADADHFFTSFIITKKQPQVSTMLYPFVDSVMGIRLVAPAELVYNKKLSSESDSWHVSGFTATDMANGMYLMLFSKDIKPGHYITGDSTIYSELVRSVKPQYPNLKIDSIDIQGYKGILMQGANASQEGIYMKALSIIRNNRNIVLLILSDSAHAAGPVTQNIISSLQFISAPALPWKVYTTSDSLFSARVPSPFRLFDQPDNQFTYAFDSTTAGTYYIRPDTLTKYVWYKNDSAFWAQSVKRFSGNDSLVSETDIQYNGAPAKELLVKIDDSYKRMRLIRHDNLVLEVFVSGNRKFVYDANANEFLNTFRINVPQQNPGFATQSKASVLLHDLLGKDSATRRDASEHLGDVEFSKEELPLLHQAMQAQYIDYYDNKFSSNNNLHLAFIVAAFKDPATIAFIKEQYPLFTGEKEYFKEAGLLTLAKMNTSESYNTLAQLVQQHGAPKAAFDMRFHYALGDSLGLTATIFPTLLQLAKDSAHTSFVASVVLTLQDSGFIKPAQLVPYQNDFVRTARQLLPTAKKEEYLTNLDELLRLIGSFNTTAGNAVLKSYSGIKEVYVQKTAVIELLKNKQPIPPATLLTLAADKSIRTTFYADLKKLKKTALFPKQYATQQAFGEADVYELATDDYELKKITFIGKRIVNYLGKPHTFYLFKVVVKDGEEAGFLGIAGAYKPNSTSLEVVNDLSTIYWDEAYDTTKVSAQLKKHLKSMEDWEKKRD